MQKYVNMKTGNLAADGPNDMCKGDACGRLCLLCSMGPAVIATYRNVKKLCVQRTMSTFERAFAKVTEEILLCTHYI